MSDSLTIRISEGDRTAFDGRLTTPLELGRQQAGELAPYAVLPGVDSAPARLVVARQDDRDNISRRHALLEPLSSGRVRLTNRSKAPLPCGGAPGGVLAPGGAVELAAPFSFSLPGRTVTVGAAEALVQIVGLELGRVLLLDGEQWVAAAAHGEAPTLGRPWQPSRRVQGLTKYLKCPILVTRVTREGLGDGFTSRRVVKAQVVNIAEPVDLYEVEAAGLERRRQFFAESEAALEALEAGDFALAAHRAGMLLLDHRGDGPLLLILSRASTALVQDGRGFDAVWAPPGK